MVFAHAMALIWARRVTFQNVQIIVHIRMDSVIERGIDVSAQRNMRAPIVDKKHRMDFGKRLILIRDVTHRREVHHMAVQYMAIQCT